MNYSGQGNGIFTHPDAFDDNLLSFVHVHISADIAEPADNISRMLSMIKSPFVRGDQQNDTMNICAALV